MANSAHGINTRQKFSREPKKEAPWQKNVPTLVGTYSILAALAGALLAFSVIESSACRNYFCWWPIALFSLSTYLFIKGIEKLGDALDEEDVDKYLTWFLAYNVGVICLFFGIATFVMMHFGWSLTFSLTLSKNEIWPFIRPFIPLGLASYVSGKWFHDIFYLLFKNEKDYQNYRRELLGEADYIEPDPDWLMGLHRCIRKMFALRGKESSQVEFKELLIELKTSKIHGIGVFAAKEFTPGDFIGEGIHDEDYRDLVPWSTFVGFSDPIKKKIQAFCIGTPEGFIPPEDCDFNKLTPEWYLNHSCNGNVGFDGNGDFVAARHINVADELTYDYGLAESNPEFRMACSCGNDNCRKIITGNDWKDPQFRRKHLQFMLPKLRSMEY